MFAQQLYVALALALLTTTAEGQVSMNRRPGPNGQRFATRNPDSRRRRPAANLEEITQNTGPYRGRPATRNTAEMGPADAICNKAKDACTCVDMYDQGYGCGWSRTDNQCQFNKETDCEECPAMDICAEAFPEAYRAARAEIEANLRATAAVPVASPPPRPTNPPATSADEGATTTVAPATVIAKSAVAQRTAAPIIEEEEEVASGSGSGSGSGSFDYEEGVEYTSSGSFDYEEGVEYTSSGSFDYEEGVEYTSGSGSGSYDEEEETDASTAKSWFAAFGSASSDDSGEPPRAGKVVKAPNGRKYTIYWAERDRPFPFLNITQKQGARLFFWFEDKYDIVQYRSLLGWQTCTDDGVVPLASSKLDPYKPSGVDSPNLWEANVRTPGTIFLASSNKKHCLNNLKIMIQYTESKIPKWTAEVTEPPTPAPTAPTCMAATACECAELRNECGWSDSENACMVGKSTSCSECALQEQCTPEAFHHKWKAQDPVVDHVCDECKDPQDEKCFQSFFTLLSSSCKAGQKLYSTGGKPSVPRLLTAAGQYEYEVTLLWAAPTVNFVPGSHQYRVTYEETLSEYDLAEEYDPGYEVEAIPTFPVQEQYLSNPTDTTITVSGLKPGTLYLFKVYGLSPRGASEPAVLKVTTKDERV